MSFSTPLTANTDGNLSSPRGPRLATRVWTPSRGKKALVILVHGIGLHTGYFEGLAARLNREGFVCVGYDQAGMGQSDRHPKVSHGTVHVKRFSDWIDDLFAAIAWAQAQMGRDLPLFLMGEDVGGLEVLVASLEREQQRRFRVRLSGVVVLNAHLRPIPSALPSTIAQFMYMLFAPCCPMIKLSVGNAPSFDDAFGSIDWCLAARQDPAVLKSPVATLSTTSAILQAGSRVASEAKSFKVPLLAIHTVHDTKTDFEAMRKFADQTGGDTLWIEDSTGHWLLLDHRNITERVKNKIAEWMFQHTMQ